MAPTALTRIHSILKHAVAMRDADVEIVVQQLETIMRDDGFAAAPQLRSCVTKDDWLPIASLLNYSALGATVWPFGGVGVVADCLQTRGSTIVELSGDGSCVRKRPLRVQARAAIEWIFSDMNYPKDVHLHLLQDADGLVPIGKIISSYQNVKALAGNLHYQASEAAIALAEALESSAELVVKSPASRLSADGAKVRRKTLAEKICSQVEWYLEPEQLQADRFLFEATVDHDGWIPVQTLLSFPRMRKLCHPQVGAVAHVLSTSKHLEVSPDMALVRPGTAPPSSPARILKRSPSKPKPKPYAKRSYEPKAAAAPDFSLMTYNILADMLCTTEQFPKTEISILDWEHRKALLLAEINAHTPGKRSQQRTTLTAALLHLPPLNTSHHLTTPPHHSLPSSLHTDILCLQELQGNAAGAGADDHHAALSEALRDHGYDGRYVRKTKRNGIGWPHTQIGNALFWRENTFEFLEHVEVLIAVMLNAACEDEPSRAHFGRGAQVGLCVALRHIRSGQEIVAVTTHLSCNFQEPWTQVAQVHTVLSSAAALAKKYGPSTPVVLGADLNSIPGSGVYHLVASGTLSASHPHLKIIAEHVEFPDFSGNGDSGGGKDVHQPIDFGGRSVYATLLGQEPLFTNFTPGFVGTLDYIFASNGLTPLQVLNLPSEDAVRQEGHLPASQFPSDHCSLFARFAITTPTAIATTGSAVVSPASSPPMRHTNAEMIPPVDVNDSSGGTSMLPQRLGGCMGFPSSEASAAAASASALMPPPSGVPHHVRPPAGEPSPSKRCRSSNATTGTASSSTLSSIPQGSWSSNASSAASSAASSPNSQSAAAAAKEAEDVASVVALDAVHIGGRRGAPRGGNNSSHSSRDGSVDSSNNSPSVEGNNWRSGRDKGEGGGKGGGKGGRGGGHRSRRR